MVLESHVQLPCFSVCIRTRVCLLSMYGVYSHVTQLQLYRVQEPMRKPVAILSQGPHQWAVWSSEQTAGVTNTSCVSYSCQSHSLAVPSLFVSLCHCVNTNEHWAVITRASDDSVWVMYHSYASVSCQSQDVFSYLGNEMSNADSKLWCLSSILVCSELRWVKSLTFRVCDGILQLYR